MSRFPSEQVGAGVPEFEPRPIIEEPNLPILWPHEAGGAIRWDMGINLSRNKAELSRAWNGNVERLAEVAMREINGAGSELLVHKYFFIQAVRNMGYRTPRQALVSSRLPHGVTTDHVTQLFPDPEEPIICKPHLGAGGQGIVELKASDLPRFTDLYGDDTIVQERVPKELEVRYVRQTGPEKGRTLRVYDEKVIPKIPGDGTSPKWNLIVRSDMPLTSKLATAALNWRTRKTVVPNEGYLHVSAIGVPSKDVLEWEQSREHRVANMDRFMKQFLTDLQTEIGQELPLVCFDIGITDLSALDGEYDFERMKECVVPFEFQMPFGINGYLWRSTRQKLATYAKCLT